MKRGNVQANGLKDAGTRLAEVECAVKNGMPPAQSLAAKAFRELKRTGVKSLFFKARAYVRGRMMKANHIKFPTAEELQRQASVIFAKDICFSVIVPLYNTPIPFLRELIESVQKQTYKNWELCLADGSDPAYRKVAECCNQYARADARVKYHRISENHGIAENTNEGLRMATGDYFALLDHDDLLHPSALFEAMTVISQSGADYIYTDEALFEKKPGRPRIIHYKSDFGIDTLRAYNYICHLSIFSRALQEKAGFYRKECDGSQDYDMALRLAEKAQNIVHIPKVLYFWRAHATSVAGGLGAKPYTIGAAHKALEDHLLRMGLKASLRDGLAPSTYHIEYAIEGNPLVSILIPNKDEASMLKDCVASIHARSTYTNYEIIIIENNSETEEIHACYQELQKDARVRVIYWEGEFNYASINNFGVKQAKGEYLLFLNNDITVITPDWIQELLMFVQRSDVGAAGAKLYYPDGSIQHAGVIVGIGGYAGHAFKRGRPEELGSGYMCRLDITQNLSAVTGACLMVRKAVFDAISGFDSLYKVAANDVDICLRIRRAGYLVVFTPFAELYHYESKTRGYEDTPEKQARLEKELSAFRARWKDVLEQGDPYYNPNLTLDHEDLSYKQIKMRNFIRLFRPKQWTKNGIVFAALIFSGNFFTWPLLLRTLEGVAVFCAISSAVYILNDIVDRKKDAEHPSKCRRPIASGAISVPVAAAISGGLFLFGFAAAWMLNLYFALVILAYVVINVFYTFHLKNIPILDIMCIAAGFVLRALSGSFLIQVGISPWLIVCTMLLSLFLAIQKRRSEFLRMKELGKEGRAVLRYYTADLLRDMCSVIDSATIMAYCLYTINQERAIPMMFTIPFVIYGLFRYQLIVHTMDLAETPEMALLKDRPLLIDILLWGATCMGIIYFL